MRPSTKWPEQGVGDGGGLLGDLLEHEVLVAALLGGGEIPVDVKLAVVGDVVAVEVGDPVAVGGDHHGLVLAQLDGVAGVLDERGHVRADEHLAVADAEHQRRGPAGGDDRARLVGVGEHQREVALQPGQHGRTPTATKSPAVSPWWYCPGDQVHGDLGVGVAGELDAVGFQLLAQHGEVLDDPVVDDRDLARGVAVRVGVAVGRPAVGGPAGVAEAGAAREAGGVGFGQRRLQVGQPAGAAAHGQAAVTVEQRDARGVVAAVLHPAQRVDDDAAGVPRSDVADDSTHSPSSVVQEPANATSSAISAERGGVYSGKAALGRRVDARCGNLREQRTRHRTRSTARQPRRHPEQGVGVLGVAARPAAASTASTAGPTTAAIAPHSAP